MVLLGSSIAGDVGLRLLLCPFGSNIVMRTACCSVGVVLPVYSTFKAIERKNEDDQQRMLLYWAVLGGVYGYDFPLAVHLVALHWAFRRSEPSTGQNPQPKNDNIERCTSLCCDSLVEGSDRWRVLTGAKLSKVLPSEVQVVNLYGSFSLVEIFSDKLLSWFPLYYHVKFGFLVWLQLPSLDGAKQLYISHLRPFFLRHQSRLDQVLGFVYVEMMKLISAHQTEIQYAKTVLGKMMGSVEQVARGSARPNRGSNQSAREIEGHPRSESDAESDTE